MKPDRLRTPRDSAYTDHDRNDDRVSMTICGRRCDGSGSGLALILHKSGRHEGAGGNSSVDSLDNDCLFTTGR